MNRMFYYLVISGETYTACPGNVNLSLLSYSTARYASKKGSTSRQKATGAKKSERQIKNPDKNNILWLFVTFCVHMWTQTKPKSNFSDVVDKQNVSFSLLFYSSCVSAIKTKKALYCWHPWISSLVVDHLIGKDFTSITIVCEQTSHNVPASWPNISTTKSAHKILIDHKVTRHKSS